MSMFHVGQRVEFVGAFDRTASQAILYYATQGIIYPVKGCVYTIRRFGVDRPYLLYFEEIVNPILPGDASEGGFHQKYFRPVKDTSIEVFRSLLSPIPEEVA